MVLTTILLVSVVSIFGTNFNVLVPVFAKMELHRDAAAFGGLIPFGSLFAGSLAHWIKAPLTFALGGLICGAVFLIVIVQYRNRMNPMNRLGTSYY